MSSLVAFQPSDVFCGGVGLSKESSRRVVGKPPLDLGKILCVRQWMYVELSSIDQFAALKH